MPFNIDPNTAPLVQTTAQPYGVGPAPTPDDDSGGALPVIQGRSGSMHLPGGGSPFTNPRGSAAANKPGYAPPKLPPIVDYLQMRARTDKIPSLATADDDTLVGLANDYAKTYVPAFHESSGFKLDKDQRDATIGNFMMAFHNDLPQFKDYFTKKENEAATKAAAPTEATTTQQALGLGQRFLGRVGEGVANFLHGIPDLVDNTAGVLGLGGAPDLSKSLQDALAKPEAWMRAGAEQNLPGGSQVNPLVTKSLAQHPIATGAAEFAGGAAPFIASGPLKLPGMLATGAALVGGQAGKEQEDRINAMKPEELAQVPEYQRVLKLTGDPVKSRALVADTAGKSAQMMGEIFGAAMNTVGGGALTETGQKLIAKVVGESVFKRVLASAVGEGAGFGALGVGQKVAETARVNQLTGEKREPDLTEGLGGNIGLGLLFGTLGGLGHAKTNFSPQRPAEVGTPQPKPGETGGPDHVEATPPPPGAPPAGLSPEQTTAHNNAVDATLKENTLKPGASPDTVNATLASALDDLEARLAAEDIPQAQIDQAKTAFEAKWRQANNIPAAEAAPGVKEGVAPTQEEAAKATEEKPAPEAPPAAPEAPAAAPSAAVEPEIPPHVPLPDALRAPVETPIREVATQPGVDPRYPLGLTERIVEEWQKGNPGKHMSPEDINSLAKMHLDTAGVSVDDVNRREAFGKLLEENPGAHPTKEEIIKKAGELLNPMKKESARQIALQRMTEFDKHPAKVAEREAARVRDTLKRSADLVKGREADRAASEQTRTEQLQNVLKKTDELQKTKETAEVEEVQRQYREEQEKTRQQKEQDAYETRQRDYTARVEELKTHEETMQRLADEAAERRKKEYDEKGKKLSDADRAAHQGEEDAANRRKEEYAAKAKALETQRKKDVADHEKSLTAYKKNTLKKAEPEAAGEEKTAEPKFSRPESKEPFYSALHKSLVQGKGAPVKASGKAWKEWLDGAQRRGEFKGSERQWLGIDAWLEGKENVTRQELQDFVRGNQVEVKTVKLADKEIRNKLPANWKIQPANSETEYRYGYTYEVVDEKGEVRGMGNEPEHAAQDALVGLNYDLAETASQQHPKFASYVLPGGENYREHLLTLPEGKNVREEVPAKYKKVVQVFGAFPRQFGTREEAQQYIDRLNEVAKTQPAIADTIKQYPLEIGENHVEVLPRVPAIPAASTFRSGHYDEPNILAHVRMNDRTTADGAKALHIEEIQSDWHQKGRKEGYAKGDEVALGQRVQDLKPAAIAAVERNDNLGFDIRAQALQAIRDHADWKDRWGDMPAEDSHAIQEWKDAVEAYTAGKGGVPDAPLKNTEDWAMLGFKHALREAVETGKDKVTWTTGDQQAERYKLSNSVDEINVVHRTNALTGEKTRSIQLDMKDNSVIRLGVNKDGIIDNTNGPNAERLHGKKLEDVVGKPLAEKLMEATSGTVISGEGLDIGAHGMRGFYDKILPKAVEKYVKQWGGKVGTSEIKIEHQEGIPGRNVYPPDKMEKVHSVDITPEMRASVEKGQPLFQKGEGGARQSGIPENLPTRDSSAAQLLSERVSSWSKERAKYESVREDAVPTDLKETLDAFHQATGVKPVLVKNLTPHVENFEGVAFGDKLLFIDESAEHPLVTLVGHEFGHDLARNNPELYKDLADEVKRQLELTGRLPDWIKNLETRGYKNVTKEGAVEELVGNGIGDAFADPKFLDQLAKRNPSLFSRVADAFVRFLNNLLDKVGALKDLKSNKYLHDIDDFRNKLLDVLEKYQPSQGAALRAETPKFSRNAPPKDAEEVQRKWHETTAHEPTRTDKIKEWTTKNVNELKPLQHLNRALEKAKIKVTPEKNMFNALTLLKGRTDFTTNHDIANTLDPALNQIGQIAQELGVKGKKEYEKFIQNANDAIAARHALERNKLLYLQSVRLNDTGEVARAPLLEKVFKGEIKPEDYLQQLKEIVYKPGAIIEKTGKRMGSGIPDDIAHQLIKKTKGAGITDSIAERLNSAIDGIRNKTLSNGYKSGRYTAEQRNLQKAYQFKYYLPFKGFADEGPLGVDSSRRPLGAFNKDQSYMEGRTSQSKNPLENLFADLAASSRDIAYNEAAKTIYKATSDPKIGDKLGTKIRPYNINKMTADALAGGGKLADIDNIFRNPNTVIFNNGPHRFSIEFPEGSKELAAIKSVQKDNTLDGFSKAVGRLTNLYARAKTAYSPVFDIYTALVRDTTTYPIFGTIEHGPEIGARYIGNLASFGGPFGAWRTYVSLGHGEKTFGEIEKMAQASPNSFAGWAYRLSKSGGGLEFRQELNSAKKLSSLSDELARKASNPISLGGIKNTFLGWLDGLATSAIATGRVSMFKALVESGMPESEAGLYTKRLLNFQQTSEGSRRMNAYMAFWRAGIANADRLHEMVHNPDGSFNQKRFGMLTVAGIGAAAAWNEVLKAYYGDDYKKLLADTISKNFVLPITYNGEPVKLPMGLGLPRLMFGLGMLGVRWAEGTISSKDMMESVKNTLFENLSPLKPSQSKENATAGERAVDLLMSAVPSPVRPVAELERNETVFGHAITPTPAPGDTRFRADSGWRSTPSQWKDFAGVLKDKVGVDVYPESLEYIANSYGAGFMTEALRSFILQNKEEQGKQTAVTDYPFVPRFTTGDIKYAGANKFYEERDVLKDVEKQKSAIQEKWADSHPGRDKKEAPIPSQLQKQLDAEKEIESANRAHNKDLKAVEDNKLLSPAAKASRLAAIQSTWARTQEQLTQKAERINAK